MRLTSTDILPARFATASAAAARQYLFADLDGALAARIAPGDVVVAEVHHGTADAAAAALAALRASGVVAMAAREFAPAVEAAALAAGIVTVALDAPAFIHTGDRLRIDLEAAKVVNLSSGDRVAIRNLTDERRAALRAMFERRGERP
jgi:3-isopropylmalate dehydratase small subunit